MDSILKHSIEWLDRLIAFDTTSRLSYLDLIADVEKYMKELGVPTRLTYDKDKTKRTFGAQSGHRISEALFCQVILMSYQ